MSYYSLRDRWLDFNIDGKGKPTGKEGNNRYDNNVLYDGNNPQQRFMRDAWNAPVVLAWTYDSAAIHQPRPDTGTPGTRYFVPGNRTLFFHVPDIGVFSRFEGDQMTDDDLHDRLKYVFLMEARSYCEEKVERKTAEQLQHSWCRDQLERGINAQYERWDEYSRTFRLRWPDLPDLYREQVVSTINNKVEAYLDPKAIARRQRNHARSLAKKALEVETKRK
jgi:hypothetical protein